MKDVEGFTCDDCRFKVELNDCPWDFMYGETDYAEDCMDFRYTGFPETAFDYNGMAGTQENGGRKYGDQH